MRTGTHAQRGLALTEMLVAILTVGLLAALLLPALARARPRTKRVGCTSNLKQVGLAYRLFANDHSDRFPFAVSDQPGGTWAFANSPQVFRHYQALSNELVTPKVLVCNSDLRSRASDFSTLANSNLSYFVGLDAHQSKPEHILSGDRNITGGTLSDGYMRFLTSGSGAGWGTNMHVDSGNLGMADGSTQQVNEERLGAYVTAQALPMTRLAIP